MDVDVQIAYHLKKKEKRKKDLKFICGHEPKKTSLNKSEKRTMTNLPMKGTAVTWHSFELYKTKIFAFALHF